MSSDAPLPPGASTLAKDGDIVSVDLITGVAKNETTGVTLQGRPVAPFLLTMLEAGGIMGVTRHGGRIIVPASQAMNSIVEFVE